MGMGGGGGGYASMYEGIAGGTLGGIGDIINATKHKKLKFPEATSAERRQRRMTMQDLENSRSMLYSGAGMYNQTLPMMYNAIPGVQADVSYDPQAQQSFQDAYSGVQNRIGAMKTRNDLKAAMKGAKKGPEKKAARQAFRGAKRNLRGMPSLGDLNQTLYAQEAGGPKMKVTQKAPTQTDQQAQGIQDALSSRTLAALHGDLANPMLERQLGRERLGMEGGMRGALGEDWTTSSPGIEAQARFGTYANDMRDQSNRRDISQLYPEQLFGQQKGLTFGGMRQQLLSAPAEGQGAFGHNIASMQPYETGAQSPYQFDRTQGFGATQANWNYGDPYAHGLIDSGNRWASIAGGQGSSAGTQSYAPPSSSSQPYYGNANNAQVGQDAWAVDNGSWGGY